MRLPVCLLVAIQCVAVYSFLPTISRVPSSIKGRSVKPHSGATSIPQLSSRTKIPLFESGDSLEKDIEEEEPTDEASKRQMLRFAVPALGIYLTNPLLSNIDNAFVGRTVGTVGLAALSPATICTDQMIYLFSFLGRATTGIVSRAYYTGGKEGNTEQAREAGSARKCKALCPILIYYAILSHLCLCCSITSSDGIIDLRCLLVSSLHLPYPDHANPPQSESFATAGGHIVYSLERSNRLGGALPKRMLVHYDGDTRCCDSIKDRCLGGSGQCRGGYAPVCLAFASGVRRSGRSHILCNAI